MKELFNKKVLLITLFILIAAFSRLIPGIDNFNPIMAIALFGGAYISNKKLAFLIPISAMLISDIFIGFHSLAIVVYGGFAIGVLIGFILKKRIQLGRIVLSSLACSIIFFIITNFGFWLVYLPLNMEGLAKAYIDAIPFFRNSLIGDLVYT